MLLTLRNVWGMRMRLTILASISYAIYYFSTSNSSTSASVLGSAGTAPSVAIVAALTQQENASWIGELFPQFHAYLYSVDDPTALLSARNKGHEGSAYLTYLIDHYDSLEDYVIFRHAARYQWHEDDRLYDGAAVMKRLEYVGLKSRGYRNLRCVQDSKLTIRPKLQWAEGDGIGWMTLLGQAFAELFPGEPVPEVLRTQCCAQSVVTKERIRQRSRKDYVRYRDFLYDWRYHKYLPDVTPPINVTDVGVESGLAGEMLENLWGIMFGRPADDVEEVADCYCETFGLCDLVCEGGSRCRGQYWQPPSKNIPVGWPESGQGSRGWPSDGWWRTARQ